MTIVAVSASADVDTSPPIGAWFFDEGEPGGKLATSWGSIKGN